MRCPECEHDNTEGAWLCINCGSKLPRPDDDAPEIKMAHHYNASPDIGNVLYLVPDEGPLDEYMKNGEYTLRTELVADELILQDLEIEVSMVFDVRLVNKP